METRLYTFIDLFKSEIETQNGRIKIDKIVIPKIQRDYAQGRKEYEIDRIRSRFLDALYRALTEKPITLDFIYGDFCKGKLIPLDGQQRLTTLYLLHWYAGKKDHIQPEEMAFLRSFIYETRYSATDFCGQLIGFMPSFEKPISKDIINQAWFPLEWQKDQTIASMLVMLDAIDAKFRAVDNLWNLLTAERRITFYLLPLKEMGLTDELYIKMNSRGKPLTQFEHFKAELEKNLIEIDSSIASRIIHKIDTIWADMLWEYRGDNNITDDEFLHYFKYICDIICYTDGGTPQGRSYDEFDLLKAYFSKDDIHIFEHINLLENYFDCWCNLPHNETPSVFLSRFISHVHESGKIKIETRHPIDVFRQCLNNYAESSGRNRVFPLHRIILLYAIIKYLLNRDTITEEEFSRRLRIVNNLILNSEFEISDSISRTSGNRIPAILQQVDQIIRKGVINLSIDRAFNVNQLNEEQRKQEWLLLHPEDTEKVFELEDHDLLTGQIGILGLKNVDWFSSFAELFKCNWDKIDCALIAIGKYWQRQQANWRFQFGTSSHRNFNAWQELFHKSGNQDFEKTSAILIQLLKQDEHPTNESLDGIIKDYLQSSENNSHFEWRYYYIKYPVFRPASYGVYSNTEDKPYTFSVMQTKSHWSSNTYMPFLKAADPEHTRKEYWGQRLVYENCYIICENSAFVVKDKESNEIIERIPIPQTNDGIDVQDRINILKEYLKEKNLQ